MEQLPLAISAPVEPGFDTFVPGANVEALAQVRALAQGTLREAIVYLWGEPGSGKSHLLHAAARANPALVVFDDVERLDPPAQQALFNAINTARNGPPRVLAAGSAAPGGLALREDLRTRLGWGLVYQLHSLTDVDKSLHLRTEAGRRGLRLSDDVVSYLLTRLPRDLGSLNAVLEHLDRYALSRKRPLTLPLVREALDPREKS